MLLLIFFAFFGGIVTILSPCILPILPIVLSGSVDGGKRRPWGIVAGFIASFTFFTLFLSAIVKITGLSADFLRLFSIVIVFLFGVSLLIPKTQLLIEKLFSRFSSLVPMQKNRQGFWGGVLIGISLGLVWTPCVGPIMAAIITLAATSNVTFGAFFLTLAYAVGTAIPMLGVMYGGRQLLLRTGLLQKSSLIQKIFGILMILTALAIYFNIDRRFQTYILEKFPQYGVGLTQLEDNEQVKQRLEQLQSSSESDTSMLNFLSGKARISPELIAGGEWFNSDPLTLAGLRGKVVLIDFWTYTCINCIRTLPYLKSWHEKYKDKGLVIIGVHTPEFEFEKSPNNVAQAIKDFGLTYPVMQDNEFATWTAYRNRYWPAKYFINHKGELVWEHFGEGSYDESEAMIQKLLKEAGASVENVPILNPTYQVQARTPELYVGYGRIEYFASPERLSRDKAQQYSIPSGLPLHHFAFSGTWAVGEEQATASEGSKLELSFEAKEVFLVLRPGQQQGVIRVLLDGAPVTSFGGADVIDSTVTVTTDRKYDLIKLPESGRHSLILEFLTPEIEVFAFTFG